MYAMRYFLRGFLLVLEFSEGGTNRDTSLRKNIAQVSFFQLVEKQPLKTGRSRSRNLEGKLYREWSVETTITGANDESG